MDFKEKVYSHFRQLAKDKVISLEQKLEELFDSARNETKSTAGDKHETALAMLQIEQENARRQLKEARELRLNFEIIDSLVVSIKVIKGSLVKTNRGHFLITVALGKVTVDNITVIAISPQSPLGTRLMGMSNSEIVSVNGMEYVLEQIM